MLGLNVRNQNKKSPAHADIEKEDDTADLSSSSATTFRTCVGVLMYLANDVPQTQHVIRHGHLCLTVLRHLVGYLCSHMDVCVSLKWDGQATGIFHDYPNVDPNEHVLEVFTDSDWASGRVSRRSVSCCIVMFGKCLIYSASRTQKIISLSSAEAEVYACSSGASDAILLARLLTWITNKRTLIYIYTDSSGAKGILNRRGVGHLRHLSCRILWLQDMVGNGMLKLCSISGHSNPADIGTKRLPAPRMRSLMSLLGLYNRSNGCLEGADDPGRVFVRRVNHRALAGALSLIQLHLQGCDSTLEDGCGCNLFILLFTLCVGVGMIWFFNWFARVAESPQDNDTPVLEEPTMNEINDDEGGSIRMSHIGAAIIAANSEFRSNNAASSSTSIRDPIEMPVLRDENDLPEPHAAWSPEAMLTFIYSRCLRRRSTAVTLERQQLYEERLQLLCNVMNACKTGDQSTRLSAAVMARNMTNLSSDEESPNDGQSWIQLCNTMDEVEHAVEIGQRLSDAVALERDAPATSGSSHVGFNCTRFDGKH